MNFILEKIERDQVIKQTKLTTELEHFILQQCMFIELWPEWLLPEILQSAKSMLFNSSVNLIVR